MFTHRGFFPVFDPNFLIETKKIQNRITSRLEECYFTLFKNIYILGKHYQIVEKCSEYFFNFSIVLNVYQLSNNVFQAC